MGWEKPELEVSGARRENGMMNSMIRKMEELRLPLFYHIRWE